MQIDGTNVNTLARDLEPTECAPYYISPDGKWVAYQEADDGLWVVSTSGGSPTLLSEAMPGSVSWFPDSGGVVYTENDNVYAQWLDVSQPRQPLAVGGRQYLFPSWSPDGKYIAFLETTVDRSVFNVILIQSDGTGWRTLGTTPPGSPDGRLCPDIVAWSPDSTRFLVEFGEPAFAFYVTGGSPVPIGAGRAPSNHAWSPDGRNLTYFDEFHRLWLARADGSEHKLLTDFPVEQVAWSPQDSLVAYVGLRHEDTNLEIINVETGETRALTGSDSYVESTPRWTPDGAFLIFVRHVIQDKGDSTEETLPAPTAEKVSTGIWRVAADGSGVPERLALTGDAVQVFAFR